MADTGTPNDSTSPPARKGASPYVWWVGGAALLLFIALFFSLESTAKISFAPQFQTLYKTGQLKKFALDGKDWGYGEVRDANSEVAKEMKLSGGKFRVRLDTKFELKELIDADDEYRANLKKQNPDDATAKLEVTVNDEAPQFVWPMLMTVLLFLGFMAFFVFFVLPRMRDPNGAGFANSFTRSPAKRFEKKVGRTTFEDVAGMEGVKSELLEIVDFLRNPDKFTRLGAQIPKGVLLIGPPGTGKTLLARAVAGEANVPFFSINGSEFIQMFVGVGASRVRDLFRVAKETAPCVVFIDEIDAVGRMRGTGVGGGSDEREQTLNQILSEMDGFAATETVIVIAATNRPDVLDAALLRPGRFDRHVTVDKPTWQGRLAILKVHTRNKPLDDALDLERIARAMIGMSGADLRNLCNEAALHATRMGKNRLDQDDFDAASDRVRLGSKREETYGEVEKRRTAYHEAGHALCAYLEPKTDPIERVSIVPRGQAGGWTLFSPDEERIDRGLSEMMARLVVAMGGRAADKLVCGEALSGAMGDIRQATRIARAMVTQFGMSERLGPVHYRQSEDHVFLGKEIAESREFSEGTARIIDEEIQRIIGEAEARATALLTRNRDDLDKLAGALLINEELDRAAIQRLLKRGGSPEPEPKPEPRPEIGGPPILAFGGA